MTFENIVAKGEIAHDEQFLLRPQCFQLYLSNKLFLMEIFQVFVYMFSKSNASDLSYVPIINTKTTRKTDPQNFAISADQIHL